MNVHLLTKALLGIVAALVCLLALGPVSSPLEAQFPDGGGSLSNLEAQLSQSINAERKNAGLTRLFPQEAVMRAAQYHASKMASAGELKHADLGNTDDLNGDNKINGADRLLRFGYTYRRSRENIGSGYATPAKCVAGWMASKKGHKEHILADDVTHIGVGVATAANGTRYYCAVFAKPR